MPQASSSTATAEVYPACALPINAIGFLGNGDPHV
jgi:hypothetical protein